MIIKVHFKADVRIKGDLKNGITLEDLMKQSPSSEFERTGYDKGFFGRCYDNDEVFEYNSMAEFMIKFDKDIEGFFDSYLDRKFGEWRDGFRGGMYYQHFEIIKIEGSENI